MVTKFTFLSEVTKTIFYPISFPSFIIICFLYDSCFDGANKETQISFHFHFYEVQATKYISICLAHFHFILREVFVHLIFLTFL